MKSSNETAPQIPQRGDPGVVPPRHQRHPAGVHQAQHLHEVPRWRLSPAQRRAVQHGLRQLQHHLVRLNKHSPPTHCYYYYYLSVAPGDTEDSSNMHFNLCFLSCSLRFWFRLYWFPLKVLYATCVSSLQSVPNIPFYFFFNTLLLALLLMNIYWFLVGTHGFISSNPEVMYYFESSVCVDCNEIICVFLVPSPLSCVVHCGFCSESAKDERGERRQGVRGRGRQQGGIRTAQRTSGRKQRWGCWTSHLCPGVS